MKKFTALVLAGMIMLSASVHVMADGNVSPAISGADIYVDGQYIGNDIQPYMESSRLLVPVRSFLNVLGAKMAWDQDEKMLKIQKDKISINITAGQSDVVINNEIEKTDIIPVILDGKLIAPIRLLAEALNYSVSWNASKKSVDINSVSNVTVSRGDSRPKYVVVIDAGHGGDETGAIYGGIYEKDLNLDIAKRLNVLLKNSGIKTYMTRTDDSYVGLYERSGLANKINADLLISVHNNAGSSGTSGSMALYYPGGGNTSGNLNAQDFASIVLSSLTKNLSTDNMGVIARPHLAVLRTSKMPAVIAEVAYMTNKYELSELKNDTFKQKAAVALKNAVLAALKKI